MYVVEIVLCFNKNKDNHYFTLLSNRDNLSNGCKYFVTYKFKVNDLAITISVIKK